MTALKKTEQLFCTWLLSTMSDLQDGKKDTKKRTRAAPAGGADSGGTQRCGLP